MTIVLRQFSCTHSCTADSYKGENRGRGESFSESSQGRRGDKSGGMSRTGHCHRHKCEKKFQPGPSHMYRYMVRLPRRVAATHTTKAPATTGSGLESLDRWEPLKRFISGAPCHRRASQLAIAGLVATTRPLKIKATAWIVGKSEGANMPPFQQDFTPGCCENVIANPNDA